MKNTSIQISNKVHALLKQHCNKSGEKINKFVETIALRELKTLKTEIYKMWEPKTLNRFIVKMLERGTKDKCIVPSFVIKSISRPSYERKINIKSGKLLSSPSFYVNEKKPEENKTKWTPLKMVLYDPIVPSTSQMLIEFLNKHLLFDLNIKFLGPVADAVEEWNIYDADIISADFGVFDWSAESDPAVITLIIDYKKVEFQY